MAAYGSRRLGRLVAILTFRRRTDRLTGPARVIDGDTIVVAGQLVRLHGIDAPELDQTFWWAGPGDSMWHDGLARPGGAHRWRQGSLRGGRAGPARPRLVAKVFSPNGVDIGRRGVLAGWAPAGLSGAVGFCELPMILRSPVA